MSETTGSGAARDDAAAGEATANDGTADGTAGGGARADVHLDPASGQASSRRIVLARHARAVPNSGGGDLARRLATSGVQDAITMGLWLAREGFRPDLVIHSQSLRTTQTWEAMARGGLEAGEVRTVEALYDAGVDALREAVRTTDPAVRTLLLIGHAPAVPALAYSLGEPETSLAGLERGWPPCAVAVVRHDGAWADFPAADTRLVAFRAP